MPEIMGDVDPVLNADPVLNKGLGIDVTIQGSTGLIGSWSSRQMPGCPNLAITTLSWIEPEWRGKGLGSYFRTLREVTYKEAGFVGELCTVRDDNTVQKFVVKNMKLLSTFKSRWEGTVNLYANIF